MLAAESSSFVWVRSFKARRIDFQISSLQFSMCTSTSSETEHICDGRDTLTRLIRIPRRATHSRSARLTNTAPTRSHVKVERAKNSSSTAHGKGRPDRWIQICQVERTIPMHLAQDVGNDGYVPGKGPGSGGEAENSNDARDQDPSRPRKEGKEEKRDGWKRSRQAKKSRPKPLFKTAPDVLLEQASPK
ncbi:hypothetical protein BASA60_003483 [Batrachochytrium salamandrivorans]|nr:hypothetical protein BASA60_003483 [Batrachochytrium salamandrivorans]